MKLVVLAAGYATRLYPLTKERPKPLLELGGRPILERLLERLAPIEALEGVLVVTNTKFAAAFRQWAAGYEPARPELAPVIVDDGTTEEAHKLGAIGDLELLLRREALDDDLLVAAADSVFSESLAGFAEEAARRAAPLIALYDVGELEAIRNYSSITTAADGRVVAFEEKPEQPQSTLAGIALYFYPRSMLPLIGEYLREGNNPDQPGRLIEWLYTRVPVYSWRVPGRWYDIGSKAALEQAEAEFSKRGPQ